jgi:hypothetical protein
MENGQKPPPYSRHHAEMAQAFWPRGPVILEHEHYGPSKARGAWSGELLLKSIEDYHASYMSIHWWPRVELQENRETIERINRRLGYRLQSRSITWPATIAAGRRRWATTISAGNDESRPAAGGGEMTFIMSIRSVTILPGCSNFVWSRWAACEPGGPDSLLSGWRSHKRSGQILLPLTRPG